MEKNINKFKIFLSINIFPYSTNVAIIKNTGGLCHHIKRGNKKEVLAWV